MRSFFAFGAIFLWVNNAVKPTILLRTATTTAVDRDKVKGQGCVDKR